MTPANTNMAISNGLAQRMGVNPGVGPTPVQGTAMRPIGAPVGQPNFLGPPVAAPPPPGVVNPVWGGGMPIARSPIAYPVGGLPGQGTAMTAANPIIRNGLRRYLGNAY